MRHFFLVKSGEQQPLDSAPPQADNMETVICPTVTQTVYLRPKTQTRTVHILRAQSQGPDIPVDAAGQSYDRVSSADAEVIQDGKAVSSSGERPPAVAKDAPLPLCSNPPTNTKTEFRSFVYLSVSARKNAEKSSAEKMQKFKNPVVLAGTIAVQAETHVKPALEEMA